MGKRLSWSALVISVLIIIFGVVGCSNNTQIAKVGDESISEQELVDELKRMYGKEVLDEMVNKKVIKISAEQYQIKATKEQIDDEYNELKKDYDTEEEFNSYLKEQMGWTKEQLLEYIEHYILWEEIATKDINVAEEHIQAYYSENVDKYMVPAKIHIEQIIVKTEEEANQVVNEVNSGSDFNTLAKERSIDVLTANNGGDLGFVTTNDGSIHQEILNRAKSIGEDELAIVPVDNSYAVIRVLEHVDAKHIPLEQVKGKIKRDIALQQVSLSDVMMHLKDDLNVEILDEQLQ